MSRREVLSGRIADAIRRLYVHARVETGEGVISAAIVVLIMAILGAAMWVAFNQVWTDASSTVSQKVGEIGG